MFLFLCDYFSSLNIRNKLTSKLAFGCPLLDEELINEIEESKNEEETSTKAMVKINSDKVEGIRHSRGIRGMSHGPH